MDNFEQNLVPIIFEKLDYHVCYGFDLLLTFSSYGPE